MRPFSTRSTSLAEVLFVLHIFALALGGANASFCPTFWCCNPPNPDPQPKPPAVCGGPLEGEWTQEHHFPVAPCQSTLVHQANTYITLKHRFDNVYVGRGIGVIQAVPFVPNITATFVAIFDEETCTFAGAAYNFQFGLNDPYQWVVFKEEKKMIGSYVNLMVGYPYLSTRAQYNVTYTGPLSE